MSEKPLDCRGLACPNPVIKTKELIDRGDVQQLTVLVDNAAAQENVSRFLQRAGFEVQVEESQGTFTISGSRADGRNLSDHGPGSRRRPPSKILVLMGCDTLGRGDDFLGSQTHGQFHRHPQGNGAGVVVRGPAEYRGEAGRGRLRGPARPQGPGASPGSGSWCAAPASTIFSSWKPSRWGKPPTCWTSSPPCSWPTRSSP